MANEEVHVALNPSIKHAPSAARWGKNSTIRYEESHVYNVDEAPTSDDDNRSAETASEEGEVQYAGRKSPSGTIHYVFPSTQNESADESDMPAETKIAEERKQASSVMPSSSNTHPTTQLTYQLDPLLLQHPDLTAIAISTARAVVDSTMIFGKMISAFKA